MKKYFYIICTAYLFSAAGCDVFKKIPTNTSGGIFSLNGNWLLVSSSDNKSIEGTIVTVVPGVADGTVKSMSNNNYCLREMDVIWRNIKSMQGGSFSLETLVNACNDSKIYKGGTITVLSNDEIKISTRNASGTELMQTWRRNYTQ